jgi:hypothetical protein
MRVDFTQTAVAGLLKRGVSGGLRCQGPDTAIGLTRAMQTPATISGEIAGLTPALPPISLLSGTHLVSLILQ